MIQPVKIELAHNVQLFVDYENNQTMIVVQDKQPFKVVSIQSNNHVYLSDIEQATYPNEDLMLYHRLFPDSIKHMQHVQPVTQYSLMVNSCIHSKIKVWIAR